jgi:hypothetical protein
MVAYLPVITSRLSTGGRLYPACLSAPGHVMGIAGSAGGDLREERGNEYSRKDPSNTSLMTVGMESFLMGHSSL